MLQCLKIFSFSLDPLKKANNWYYVKHFCCPRIAKNYFNTQGQGRSKLKFSYGRDEHLRPK